MNETILKALILFYQSEMLITKETAKRNELGEIGWLPDLVIDMEAVREQLEKIWINELWNR